MKNINLIFGAALVLTCSLSSFAQTSKSCKPFLMRVASSTNSIEVQKGCESDNTQFTKFLVTKKKTSESVEVIIDSRNYPEDRDLIENNTLEIVASGLSNDQGKYIRSKVSPLLNSALDSQTASERETYLNKAKTFLESLLAQ
jgi:hypothetical protein